MASTAPGPPGQTQQASRTSRPDQAAAIPPAGTQAFAAPHGSAAPQLAECLASPSGGFVTSAWVSATDGEGIDLALPAAGRYLVVVKGTFQYSEPGFQDAVRRWYSPPRDIDPTCVACGYHPLAAKYALQINGASHRPLRSCVLDHTHLFAITALEPKVHLRISDAKTAGDPYADNLGGLQIELWRLAPEDAAAATSWDGPSTVQGVAVGPKIGELTIGTDFLLSVQLGIVLHTQHESLAVPPLLSGSGSDLLADVYGLSAWQGIERDMARQWDHVQSVAGAGPPAITFNCAKAEVVGNSQVHRYLLRLSGCPASLQVDLAAPLGVGQFTAGIYRVP